MNIDLNFFPGWTRKAITFTMDDGWLAMDVKFLETVRPAGIKGTFNIISNNSTKYNDDELIRRTYEGFEIANHVKLHPFAFADGVDAPENAPIFDHDNADSADVNLMYKDDCGVEGVYLRYSPTSKTWQRIATAKGYIQLVKDCQKELEELFGKGKIRGFVWPYTAQKNTEVTEYLKANFYGLRTAGIKEPLEDPAFALPTDRSNWQYNARHKGLLQRAKEFEALDPQGELKWFAFGVHSFDFDREGNWDELAEFCKEFGGRNEFWYASNAEIFDYEDAVKVAVVENGTVKNNSDITLYAQINGQNVTIPPHASVKV